MNAANGSSASFDQGKERQAAPLRAERISLAFILLILGGLCADATFRIPLIATIVRNTLPGSEVPLVTQFAIGHQAGLLAAAIALSALGIMALFLFRRPSRATASAMIFVIVLFAHLQVTTLSMRQPLLKLSHLMEHRSDGRP